MVLVALVAGAEAYLRWLGLGDAIVYERNTSYRYAPAPNQHVTRRHGASVTIDSVGLRGVQDWTSPADQRVLFLGDSVTWAGTGIDDHEMFSSVACARLATMLGLHVVCGNAGVNGYGTDNMARRLIYDGRIRDADLIVTTVITVDAVRGLADLQKMPFYSRQPTGPLKAVWEAMGILSLMAANWLMHPGSPDAYQPPDQYPLGGDVLSVAADSVDRLIETLRAEQTSGHKVLLVFSPIDGEVESAGQLPLTQVVRTHLAASRLPYLDLLEVVRRRYGSDFYIDGVHLQPRGHDVYAQTIAEKIAELYAGRGASVSDPGNPH